MTLKTGPMSPKSNQLVPPSQQCICASLVKIRPSVQKITRGNEATRTQTPTGSAPKTIFPPSVGGHNYAEVANVSVVAVISLLTKVNDAAVADVAAVAFISHVKLSLSMLLQLKLTTLLHLKFSTYLIMQLQ